MSDLMITIDLLDTYKSIYLTKANCKLATNYL